MDFAEADKLPRRTHVDAANYAIAQFEALGLNPPQRLVEMHNALEGEHIPFVSSSFPMALESMRDLHQLLLIFEQLKEHRSDRRYLNEVKHLLHDHVLPQDDTDSPGRDRQFQLYLAAICQKAGLVPVAHEEPDVTCHVNGSKFGIAAKRIKSTNILAIQKHIKKGARQLRGQGLRGIIALDLTMSRNPDNNLMTSRLHGQAYAMISESVSREFSETHHEDIGRWVASENAMDNVKAILIVEFYFRIKENERWGLEGNLYWKQNGPDPLFEAFVEEFSKRTPGAT